MEADDPSIDMAALDNYLMSDRSPADCLLLSDLDGFLTAIVVGPELIPPSEWLPAIWHGEEPEFESAAEARSILGTILGRYNQLATCFATDPDAFDPLFYEGPGGEVITSDWAAGFLDGVGFRRTAWEPLIGHRRANILLAPIVYIGVVDAADDENVDWAAVAKEAPRTIPICVIGIYDFWKDYQDRQKPRPRRQRRPRR